MPSSHILAELAYLYTSVCLPFASISGHIPDAPQAKIKLQEFNQAGYSRTFYRNHSAIMDQICRKLLYRN